LHFLNVAMKKEATVERRREPRVSPIRVRMHLSDRLGEGHLEDINNFGAFVTTDLDLMSGTRIDLEIDIPGQEERSMLPAVIVRRRAEVRYPDRSLPGGLGMRFVANNREELDRIRQTVITTLSLDLLGHGLKRGSAPGVEDTMAFGPSQLRPG
jgi:hypothetical protein